MMNSFALLRLCAVGFIAFLAMFPASAWGCFCATSAFSPPCQAVWNTSAVFTGSVIDITQPAPVSARPSSRGSTTGRLRADDPIQPVASPKRVIRVQLGEVLTGIQAGLKEIDIVTGMGGGDCGYNFQRGVDYVIYAYKNSEGRLEAGICSRTRPLADAAEDLAYFHAVATAPPAGEIRIVQWLFQGRVAGVRTTIEGNGGRHVVFTDAAGEAKLAGLPPGDYKIRAELDRYVPVERDVQLHAKGCVEVPIVMLLDRRIQGRVLTREGLPAANIIVEARSIGEMSGDSVKTNEEGRYELRRFRTGAYYLGINLQQPPTVENPYTRWFYPGTEDPTRATVIYFSDKAETKNYDLMLPDRQNERLVEGTVLWPDGRPAAGARLFVLDARWLWQSFVAQAVADANGHFVVRSLLDGTHYRLHVIFLNTSPYGITSAEPVDIQPGKTPLDLRLALTRRGNSVTEDQRKGVEQYRNRQ